MLPLATTAGVALTMYEAYIMTCSTHDTETRVRRLPASPFSSFQLFSATLETGNYMDLIRVDDFTFEGFPVSETERKSEDVYCRAWRGHA